MGSTENIQKIKINLKIIKNKRSLVYVSKFWVILKQHLKTAKEIYCEQVFEIIGGEKGLTIN